MNVATQISGNIHPGNKALFALRSMLAHIGINVAHPAKDEPLFYDTKAGRARSLYESELEFYQSIARSSFHIIYNDDPIDRSVGLQILYAMLKSRPIVMTGAPRFAPNADLFIRQTVAAHMQQFHSVNLPELELAELSLLLHRLRPTSYELSSHETALIRSRLKAHFRGLVPRGN